jgi:hypothetical protein
MKAMLVLAALALGTSAAAQIEVDKLLERVNGTPIMASDVRQVRLLKLAAPGVEGDAAIQAEIENRILLLVEATRSGIAEPAAEQIAAKRQAWRAQFPADANIGALLARAGMTEKALDGWFRDDLRISAYFDQRFGLAQDERRGTRIATLINDLRKRANLPAKLSPEVLHK